MIWEATCHTGSANAHVRLFPCSTLQNYLLLHQISTVGAGLLALCSVLEIVDGRVCLLVQVCCDALTETEFFADISLGIEEETHHPAIGAGALPRNCSVSSVTVTQVW